MKSCQTRMPSSSQSAKKSPLSYVMVPATRIMFMWEVAGLLQPGQKHCAVR